MPQHFNMRYHNNFRLPFYESHIPCPYRTYAIAISSALAAAKLLTMAYTLLLEHPVYSDGEDC